jgi:hypothetical protein
MFTRKPETKLEKEVAKIIRHQVDKTYDQHSFLEDLYTGGCASGLVGSLIYYKDTLPFYKRHRAEIGQLVREYLEGRMDLLRGWDDTDPLALETTNQNLLAWYGFEAVAISLLEE